MAFEIQRSKRSLPGKSGGVLTNYDFGDMGMGQLGRSLGKLGAAFEKRAIVLNRLQAENQYSESQRQVQEILDQFEDAVETEQDSTLYPSIAKQAQEAMAQVAPKNKLANRAFQQLLNRTKANMANTVLDVSLVRERDTKRANVAVLMAQGKFKAARKAIRKGVKDGTFTKVVAEQLIAESRIEEKELNRNANIQELITLGENIGHLDTALDIMTKEGLRRGMDRADINFARQSVKDDFARAEAARVEAEEKRVDEADADLSERLYHPTKKTTAPEVHAAKLPRTVRDPLLTSIRLRDKEIAEGKEVVTSPLTRTKINLIKASITSGELTVQQGINQMFKFQKDIEIKERTDVIDDFFKAGEDSQDATKRQNQTILTERGGQLRDAIERSQGVIQLVKDEQREFLIDLANDAVIELNDRFRDLDFNVNDIDAFNDSLMRKYTLSEQALARAVSMKNVLAKKTFAKQVQAMVARIKRLKNNPFEQRMAIDEGVRLGLVKEDGSPSTETREPVEKNYRRYLDTVLNR